MKSFAVRSIGRRSKSRRHLARRRCGTTGLRLARRPGLRLQIFVDAFAPAFAAEAGFAVAAEAHGGIEQIGGIHPDHAALQLGRDVERKADGLAPHAGGQSVARCCWPASPPRPACGRSCDTSTGPKISSRRDRRGGLHIGEQRRRIEAAGRGHGDLRLELLAPSATPLSTSAAMRLSWTGSTIAPMSMRLVERMADAQLSHAALQAA